MKTQVDIKLLNGSKQEVTYETVETVGMPLADGTGEQVFTAGEPLDEVPVALDFTNGNQTIEAPEGYVVRSAVIAKPEGAEQVIAKGEKLAGIPGEYVTPGTTKEIEPYFKDCLVIDNLEDVSALLSDRANIGKYVKYVGETGDYTSGQHYKVIDEYAAFARSCPATAVEVTSDTVLTATLEGCKVGDLVVAAFMIRSDLVSLSDGWTLISTSQSATEINTTSTTFQTLSFAYKYAESATEELTVMQTTAGRVLINMVSLSNVVAFTDAGYQYQDNSTATDMKSITVIRPEGKLTLWSIATTYAISEGWTASNDSVIIQHTTAPRLVTAIDISEDENVTFANRMGITTEAYICGALSIEIELLEPQLYLVEADSSEVPDSDVQTVATFGDTRWNEVLVKKPETLVSENVADGAVIAGVVGNAPVCHFNSKDTNLRPLGYHFDLDNKVVEVRHISCSKSSYNVNIPDTLGGYPVVVDPSFRTNNSGSIFNDVSLKTINLGPNIRCVNEYSMANAFKNCQLLNSPINVPLGATSVYYAFYQCVNLNSPVRIPDGVTNMGFAFYQCKKLNVSIHIPNSVTTLYYAFSYCNNLNVPINIPNSVTNMRQIFYYSPNFNQPINIPNSVTDLYWAFQGCSQFNQPMRIPNSVTSMELVFGACSNLNSPVEFEEGLTCKLYRVFENCYNFNLPVTIPNGVNSTQRMFYRCNKFNQPIVIPNSVTEAINMCLGCTSLNSPIVFGTGMISLANTFNGCTAMSADITVLSNKVTNVAHMLKGKNNSRRVNIYVPATGSTVNQIRNNTGSSYSVVNATIYWTNDAANNCFYNAIYNIYVYNTL